MAITFTDLHVHSEFSLHEIPGFDGRYLATEDGKIYNSSGEEKKPFISSTGYLRVKLYLGNNQYNNYSVHQLIAQTFIPNPDNLPQVNHKDTNKLNPRSDNLEWSTQSNNIKHAMNNGLYTKQLDNQKLASIASADKHSIPIEQLDDSGNIINTYRNKHDAAKATGATANNIKMCCQGKRKSAAGYQWRFREGGDVK